MKPGDRLVCAFVGPRKVGDKFKEWPLHVTIVPWFRSGLTSQELKAKFTEILGNVGPFEAKAEFRAKFGYSKQANLIAQPTLFMVVARRVRLALKQNEAWLVDETTHQRREYKPHVTVQPSGGLEAGDSFLCDRLYIVEQFGEYKKITAQILLTGA